MDVTLRNTFVGTCHMCVVCFTFTVVLQTREWELSPICSVCRHVETDWRSNECLYQMGAFAFPSQLVFELGFAELLCHFTYYTLMQLPYSNMHVKCPAMDMDHDTIILELTQTCMFAEKIAD